MHTLEHNSYDNPAVVKSQHTDTINNNGNNFRKINENYSNETLILGRICHVFAVIKRYTRWIKYILVVS